METRSPYLVVLALPLFLIGAVLLHGGGPAFLVSPLTSHAGHGRADASDGYIGDRTVTARDVDEPAVAKLDPDLLTALQAATHRAAEDGVELKVNSGWRSRAYQRQLLHDAIREYGSRTEALQWVDTPNRSAHVTGDAVDVGPPEGAAWLGEHGAAYGLCQVYANEAWHFELTAVAGTCPALTSTP